MTRSSPLLGGLTPEQFLADYWQKRPLLVRGALPGFTSPVSPEELAGLACEEGVASRLVLEAGGDYPWQLKSGPFEPDDFAALPPERWALLVQEVDRLVPEVSALLEHFRFVPNWRLDDVMVSYAPGAGGVGPHVDNYDVFLIQGLGRRRWQIAHAPVEEEHLVEDIDVRILADFEPDEEWILEPGDLLYLPPRIPHNGIALGDCMTYSVGFRAPGEAELVEAFLGHALEQLDPLARYADPDLTYPPNPGEIDAAARLRLRAVLEGLVADPGALDRWLGTYLTEPKRGDYPYPLDDRVDPDALAEAIREGAHLERRSPTEWAFVAHDDATATLFVGGEAHDLDDELAFAAPLLTGTARLDAATLAPHLDDAAFARLLAGLVEEGWLVLPDPSDDVEDDIDEREHDEA